MDNKVGQITLYNYNYGSALQCYATQQIVKELGFQCILFRPLEKSGIRQKCVYLIRAAIKMAMHPGHAKSFLRMMQAQRKCALSSLTTLDFQGIQKFVDSDICSMQLSYAELKKTAQENEYIAFLSGSDQIWNGSWFLRNDAFFLRFAPKEKRVAWAPSFGTDNIASYNRRRFQKDLSDYRCLSVREKSGTRIVKRLIGKKAVQIIDPVLQVPAETWRIAYEGKYDCRIPEKYVFCYFLNEPNQMAQQYLKKCSLGDMVILVFASRYPCLTALDNAVFTGGNPWNYLSLIDHAAAVCSDSFHALAFSLLFHKNMYIFHRNYLHASDQSERITSLLGKLKLLDRFVDDTTMETLSDMGKCIDFDRVDHILDVERDKARAYLEAALRGGAI